MKVEVHSPIETFLNDHHFAKLLCLRIHQGLKNGISLERIWNFCDWVWLNFLEQHILDESDFFQNQSAINDSDLKKILSKHRRIKRLFIVHERDLKTLNQIEEELDQIVRFEENLVFPNFEVNTQIETVFYHQEFHQWKDKFWE